MKKIVSVIVVITMILLPLYQPIVMANTEKEMVIYLYINNEGFFHVQPDTQKIERLSTTNGLNIPSHTKISLKIKYIGPEDGDSGDIHDFAVMRQTDGEEFEVKDDQDPIGPSNNGNPQTLTITFNSGVIGLAQFILYCILMDCDGMDHLTDIPITVV